MVIERRKEQMKNLWLKEELKKGIAIALGLAVVIGLLISIHKSTDKAIDQCVRAGHSYSYCESGLR